MKRIFTHFVAISTLATLLSSTAALSSDLYSAKQLKERLRAAKTKVSRIMSAAGARRNGIINNEVNEEDIQALTRLSQANTSLEEAAVIAEQAEIAFSALNFNLGN